MKKVGIAVLLLISLTACSGKYDVKNLKKDKKILKETILKCKNGELKDEKVCNNVKVAQNELAKEIWEKKKPEIEKKLTQQFSDMDNHNFKSSVDALPEKFIQKASKDFSISEEEIRKTLEQTINEMSKKINTKTNGKFDEAQAGITTEGTFYAWIPVQTELSVETRGKMTKQDYFFVFEENGKLRAFAKNNNMFQTFLGEYPDLQEAKESMPK